MNLSRIALLSLFTVALTACNVNSGGAGGGASGGLVSDPANGLDPLTHYRASVAIVTNAQSAGGTVNRTEKYSLAVWTKDKAIFETVDAFDDAGQPLQLTLGMVADTGYAMWGTDTGCQTFWQDTNIQVTTGDLSPYLIPLKSGTPDGDETVNGIATHVYRVDSNSLGVAGVQATGRVWVAADVGYLVKYHLELTGADALFGKGWQGTRIIDYALSEVNDGSAVAYPGDCRPVLAEIPASDDAQQVNRMPGMLSYLSKSAPATLASFYKDFFKDPAWKKSEEIVLPGGGVFLLFKENATGREVSLHLDTWGDATEVVLNASEPPGAQPATPADTPSAGSGELPLGARLVESISILVGNEKTPSPFSSYAFMMKEEAPTADDPDVTSLQAEVAGADYHYVEDSGKKKSDELFVGGQYYDIVGGKAQPGSALRQLGWLSWQLDPLQFLAAAAVAAPQAEAGTTLEGRAVDVFSIDSSRLGGPMPDMSYGLLPFTVTAMQGDLWIDHDTGALLKVDLTFEADIRKAGEKNASAHGTGSLQLDVSKIGTATVNLPK
jgi:hypothetical protein